MTAMERLYNALEHLRVRHQRLRRAALRVAEHLELMADQEDEGMSQFLRAEAKILYRSVQGDQ